MRAAIAFCTPMPKVMGSAGLRYDPITVEFHRAKKSLSMPTGFNSVDIRADGMEVGVARNKAVEIVMKHEPRPEFLFFLDYDVLPAWDAVTKLFYRARCYPDQDIFAGVYCAKGSPAEPLIYAEQGAGCYWDWTVGDIIRDKIIGCHMGLTLIRTSIFEQMGWDDPDNPLFKTVNRTDVSSKGLARHTGTEDLYFCKRYHAETGKFICVDTSVLAGHINNKTGQVFGLPNDSLPVKRATWMKSDDPVDRDRRNLAIKESTYQSDKWYITDSDVPANGFAYLHDDGNLYEGIGVCPDGVKGLFTKDKAEELLTTWEKKEPVLSCKTALDLGAGIRRREWPGYKTFTTDIREDVKPDFVMDTRWLNLPDESYDMVASSHHLEHFGRYEQADLWKEMARILKPGGTMEHVVPNLRWAGCKLANGEDDDMTSILDVLYGAQEDLNMPRDCNTHYFGYTPELARELAEEVAGLVDVTVKGYRDDPSLGFNLVICGRKPDGEEEATEPIPENTHPKSQVDFHDAAISYHNNIRSN